MGERLDIAPGVLAALQRIAHRVECAGKGVDLAADADAGLGRAFAAFDGSGILGDPANRAE